MSDEDKLRRLANTQSGKIYSRPGAKPELQIHIAATLVMAGDPDSHNPAIQSDMGDEICQYVGRFPPEQTGQITKIQIFKIMHELEMSVIKALRERGVLGPGV